MLLNCTLWRDASSSLTLDHHNHPLSLPFPPFPFRSLSPTPTRLVRHLRASGGLGLGLGRDELERVEGTLTVRVSQRLRAVFFSISRISSLATTLPAAELWGWFVFHDSEQYIDYCSAAARLLLRRLVFSRQRRHPSLQQSCEDGRFSQQSQPQPQPQSLLFCVLISPCLLPSTVSEPHGLRHAQLTRLGQYRTAQS